MLSSTIKLFAIIGVVISIVACSTLESAPMKTTKEKVLSVLDIGAEAWNKGDMDGYLATYSEDARWASGGTVIQGKAQIAAMFKSRFNTPQKMGMLSAEEVQIESISKSDAILFGHWIHKMDDQVRRGIFTLHIKLNKNDEWLIVSDHSSSDD